MDHFSISELSKLSGIKPFTIRVWEKRYKALTPDRSDGNTRYYDNRQLRRLLNIVSLLELDHKISDLSILPDSTLFRMIEEQKIQPQRDLEGFFISQLIAAGFNYDEPHFTNAFAQCLTRYGMIGTYTRVIYPMLQRIGILWNADTINASNEHFITNLLRQKVLTSTDLLASPLPTSETWLLFLPENEFHETGLLIAHYLIRLSGRKSVYLGANVPLEALFSAVSTIKPNNVLLFFVHKDDPHEAQTYLGSLAASIKSARIYVAGDQLSKALKPAKRTSFLTSVAELEKLLA
jgi:MerR family transcriptional regulator, light-induced transcriptional regulator